MIRGTWFESNPRNLGNTVDPLREATVFLFRAIPGFPHLRQGGASTQPTTLDRYERSLDKDIAASILLIKQILWVALGRFREYNKCVSW